MSSIITKQNGRRLFILILFILALALVITFFQKLQSTIYDIDQHSEEEYFTSTTACTMIILLCILWIAIACICLCLILKYIQSKRKGKETFLSNMCELKIKQQELLLLEQDSELYISELKEIKNNNIEMLKGNIDGIKITDEMVELSQKEERLLNDDVVIRFHFMAKKNMHPRPDDWQELHELLLSSIPSFFPTICRYNNIREDEKRICSLVRLHFLPSEISKLLCISKQAVTTNRKRLLAKIFGVNDFGAKEFDRRIMLI